MERTALSVRRLLNEAEELSFVRGNKVVLRLGSPLTAHRSPLNGRYFEATTTTTEKKRQKRVESRNELRRRISEHTSCMGVPAGKRIVGFLSINREFTALSTRLTLTNLQASVPKLQSPHLERGLFVVSAMCTQVTYGCKNEGAPVR